tara:strand:- start:305 stop:484 length:180 start_codon:yes stop_codon:yes gene_type:complete
LNKIKEIVKGGETINKLEKEFIIKLANCIQDFKYNYSDIRKMLLVLANGELTKSDLEQL